MLWVAKKVTSATYHFSKLFATDMVMAIREEVRNKIRRTNPNGTTRWNGGDRTFSLFLASEKAAYYLPEPTSHNINGGQHVY
ncbi:MAG: hypothetical protein IPL13_14415 [Saprospiraceae bacterium]|nr:hypothetical protein [Candidatus Brachybacter algidus]